MNFTLRSGSKRLAASMRPEAALVDEVQEGEAEAAVALGVGDHEAEVGLHQPLQRLLVALLDAAAQHLLVVRAQGLELARSRGCRR